MMGLEDHVTGMVKSGKLKRSKVRSKKGRAKVSLVMREFHAGKLHHGGSGKIVTRPDVAGAIAMSEGRKHS